MRRYKALVLFCLLSGALTPALSMAAACDDLMPKPDQVSHQLRDITAEDLVRLRDIGPVSGHDTRAKILSLSPDGSRAAFQIRRADPVTNTYCLAMAVMPTTPGGHPLLVDQGGDIILQTHGFDGFAELPPSGAPLTITPKWSPDGKWIAYLRKEGGVTQVWKARSDGGGAFQVTASTFDIEDLDWSEAGRALLVSGRPGVSKAENAIDAEARHGHLYDDRFMPLAGNRPRARGEFPQATYRVDATQSEPQAMVPIEAEALASQSGTAGGRVVVSQTGATAWSAPVEPSNFNSASAIHVRFHNQGERTLALPRLSAVGGLWWSPDGETLFFIRTEGWGYEWHASEQGLYRWDRRAKAPVRILQTDNVLIGCQIAGWALICGRETSATPRRLVRLDLRSAQVQTLFDPNPEFEFIRLGAAQRLKWTNDRGYQAWGDLVLPPDHQPGQKHPLVVVQYLSRGFLRGGTGDDYPVYLLAAKGFAVLDFEMPPNFSSLQTNPVTTEAELNRLDFDDFTNRRHMLSAVETGISRAIATGAVDPSHIGLTGLSDGSSTLIYALFNGHIKYAAMATSSCCSTETVTGMLDGPVEAKIFQAMGYPKLTSSDTSFWKTFSMRVNANRMNTPLLIQVPDREYLGALEGYTALIEQGKPAEMYVFPDEFHVKWQPSHRLATYQRSVDWFRFWLKGEADPNPDKVSQYKRWEAIRAIQQQNMTVSPGA